MTRVTTTLPMIFVGVPVALLGLDALGIVGFQYPRAIDNDPLRAPVRVVRVDGSSLELADGRVLVTDIEPDRLNEAIEASDFRIDLETDRTGNAWVFVKERGWICGTPWARLVNIRLIPQDAPLNRRVPLGLGAFGDRERL